jgi:hypothetical protein
MRKYLLMLPLLVAAVALFAAPAAAQEGPSAGEQVVDGLLQARGITIGPDGLVYVAESGSGGDTEFVTDDGSTIFIGTTGRISSIDPATGTRTTVADGLPSHRTEDGEAFGPADVAFIGDQLYYVSTLGGEAWGFPDDPTGIYSIANDGSATLVADIYDFNVDNPVPRITSGEQEDVALGGNPYSMTVRDGVFYVADSNYNQILRVTASGEVTRFVDLNANVVPTGITFRPSGGPFYVSELGPGPFLPADGKVISVASPSGTVADVASGVPMLTAVDVGPADQLYVLSFATDFAPGSGQVARVNTANGTLVPLVTGFTFAATTEFDGDTLYVLNDGINALGTGSLWAIENFSTIQPPAAPTPTAAPPAPVTPTPGTGVTAPDTGTGPDGSGTDGTLIVGLLAVIGAAVIAGGAIAARRSR